MGSIALYYPWMHFQSDDWVKLALLTWDGIVLTRPPELPSRDSELVRQVRAESDLITDATPSAADLDLVGDTFGSVLDAHSKAMVERFGTQAARPARSYGNPASNAGGFYAPAEPATPDDPRTFWVHHDRSAPSVGKMSAELSTRLIKAKLAVAEPNGRPWLGMRPELGSIYLAVLADAMSANNALSPVTDDLRMHHALGALDQVEGLLLGGPDRTPALADAEAAYVHLALRVVIEPERLAHVPTDKLIKFRAEHGAELTAFRAHVAGLGDELRAIAAVENVEVAHAHLKALYERETKPKLDDLRKGLRALGVESVAGPLALKVDAAAGTVLGGLAAAGGQLAVAGAAVAVTVVPYLAGKHKARREQKKGSPVAYLLAADRRLAGASLLRRR
ncbi:hypothetical protein EV193_10443 [Herbihabitans rhizosphaerae]|uniref:Uncharacterized protein n=1 Tax=Herbihabitans rhizosphaerae TaxID=1872711 RepID=A0A4V2ESU9_9PSEU|nr:DUF6236 family protein [Herbihabitans rhizosphaerae]RZS38833.1 hypothetical protein EV193_10443 [Herbihabitans rhizosphaerae]